MSASLESGAYIHGIGMITPVGDCAAQTAASVRAGICRYRESSVYNKRFMPMTLALLPEDILAPPHAELLAPGLTSRQIHMLRLAGAALAEALETLPAPGEPPPLFLAGPESREETPAVDESFLNHVATQAGCTLDLQASKVFVTGRAGGIEALSAAMDELDRGRKYALVGGVDSCRDLSMLAAWDREDRVLAPGVPDGFVPGEGACFLLLGSPKPTTGNTPNVLIRSPGIADEPGHRYSAEPHTGDGLDRAIRLALQANGVAPIRTVLCSLNGESLGGREWGVAALRSASSFADPLRVEHPADCLGDIGAAFGPLLVGLAAVGVEGGYIQGPALVWCASDFEKRAALLVTLNT
ncbi:MAG: beta-ketoacyl synthase N-terminal-like domain-containing protein [Planctomycetota bacterium]